MTYSVSHEDRDTVLDALAGIPQPARLAEVHRALNRELAVPLANVLRTLADEHLVEEDHMPFGDGTSYTTVFSLPGTRH